MCVCNFCCIPPMLLLCCWFGCYCVLFSWRTTYMPIVSAVKRLNIVFLLEDEKKKKIQGKKTQKWNVNPNGANKQMKGSQKLLFEQNFLQFCKIKRPNFNFLLLIFEKNAGFIYIERTLVIPNLRPPLGRSHIAHGCGA